MNLKAMLNHGAGERTYQMTGKIPRRSGRLSRAAERELWTAHAEGRSPKPQAKYGNERNGKYASGHEAKVASNLAALAQCGDIHNLREQVPFVIVPGKDGVRGLTWVADFVYDDQEGKQHWCDAKGCRTPTYKIKKRLVFLLHGISIEEI